MGCDLSLLLFVGLPNAVVAAEWLILFQRTLNRVVKLLVTI